MTEIWKDVVGYEDYFMISNHGNVWQKRTNKILVQGTLKTGYKVIQTRIGGRNGTCKCLRVHRFVAEAFIDNPENKPFVNHLDGVKINNHVDNLEWVTHQENVQHAVDNGLMKPPSQLHNRKLTDDQVEYIREHYKYGCKQYGICALSRKYNVSRDAIRSIIDRKTYKY